MALKFTVAVPKPKRKNNSGIKRHSNKLVKGKVFQDEVDGIFKIAIDASDDDIPDLLILEFTERSYDLVGKTNVFSRTADDKGKRTRFIRSELTAKFFPGLPEQYIPFAPNWIVKGYIVSDNGVDKFDFKDLVNIDGYNIIDYE